MSLNAWRTSRRLTHTPRSLARPSTQTIKIAVSSNVGLAAREPGSRPVALLVTVEVTMKLSVIALDYDGTITRDDRLDTRMREAIAEGAASRRCGHDRNGSPPRRPASRRREP